MTTTLKSAALAVVLLAGASAGAFAARTEVTIGMQLEPPNLDPTAGAAAAIDEVVYANVFEGLTRIGADGGVLPQLARSWDISDDGLVYTFHLATGVTFHDGTPFDADDVKFSLDRAGAADSVNAQKALFADIVSVEVVDPATVNVTLDHPVGDFLFNLGWGDAVIVAPETAASNATHPVGTGPFRFADWVRGDHVDLARNPDYWGTPARLDRATFKFISDPTAAFNAVEAGDVDAFPNYPAPETLDQFKGDPRLSVVVGTTEGETIMAMNNARKPFTDLAVRQAFSHAIDRRAVIDGAMFGYGTAIGSHFSPADPGYVDLTGIYPYDPDKAKELLRQASLELRLPARGLSPIWLAIAGLVLVGIGYYFGGARRYAFAIAGLVVAGLAYGGYAIWLKQAGHESGITVTLKLPPPSYARRGGEIITQQLKAVGVDAEIINVEWAQWLSDVFTNKDYDLTIVSHTEPADMNIYARDDYYFGYHSDAFKQIMGDLNAATNPARRIALLGEAQRRIAEDAVNVFLFELAKTGVWNTNLKGLWANAPIQANDLTGVYWQE